MSRTGIIYKHTNKIDGKIYIGQTIQDPKRRFRKGHLAKAYKSCLIFHDAIVMEGEINFTTEFLETNVSEDQLNSREEYYIKLYDSCNMSKGYNMKNIVDNKIVFTDEIRKKMSDKAKLRRKIPQKKKWHVFEEFGETKHCTDCKQWKLISEYAQQKDKWDNLRSICSLCQKTRWKKFYSANKQKLILDRWRRYPRKKKGEPFDSPS